MHLVELSGYPLRTYGSWTGLESELQGHVYLTSAPEGP